MANAISWMDFFSEAARTIAANESRHDPDAVEDFDDALNAWILAGTPGENRLDAAAVIRECRREASPELNLGDGLWDGFGLKALPECIGDLAHLRVLRVIGNHLERLPESIGKLTLLQDVFLFGNRLRTLPESICNCTGLERLYLAGNRLESLPEGIGGLKKLSVLSLPGNCLKTLPDSIGELGALQDLFLFDNPLLGLPDSIRHLTGLKRVYLGNQYLKDQHAALVGLQGRDTDA